MVEPRDDGDDLAQGLGEVSHVGCDSCLTLRRAISTEEGEEVLVVGHSSDSNLGRKGERERVGPRTERVQSCHRLSVLHHRMGRG